jgi:DNA-binding MarR family transcriptional regulator
MPARAPRRRAGRGFAEDTNESIGYLLRDASRRILGAMTHELEAHGISLPQYFVLRELYAEEGLTQRELANRVGVLEPTIVATLDALEKNGIVARVRSTTDRRKIGVMLTDEGESLRGTLLGYAARVLERALDGISTDEIAMMRLALKRIKANL